MQSILLSMRPQRCEKVVRGEVTLDVRKTRIKIKPPFRVYLYCTKPRGVKSNIVNVGHVIGEFICNSMYEFPTSTNKKWRGGLQHLYNISWEQLARTAMTHQDLCNYGGGKLLHGLEISDFKPYAFPMELNEFSYAKAPDMQDVGDELCSYCEPTFFGKYSTILTPNGVYMCEGEWCVQSYEQFLRKEYVVVYPPRSFCRVEVIEI